MTDRIDEKKVKEAAVTEENTAIEMNKGFNFKAFIKKYGFYIGIALIMTVALIVLFSDRDVSFSGDVSYDKPVYYITGNNLYIKERGKDEILISSTMFQNVDDRTKEDALAAALISPDGSYIYFYENITYDTKGVAFGDFCVYQKSRKHLIEENTGIYFAISDDSSKVAYIKPSFGVQGGTGYDNVRYDLYTYTIKGGKQLVEGAVEYAWYNLSGDGKTVFYTKNYDATTDTSSLFMNRDGKSTFIDDHMFFYGDIVPNGTFRQNWPKTNIDASKIIYGKRMNYGEMASMYLYADGQSTLLGDDVLQIFVDENLDRALMLYDYDSEVFTGSITRINLDTLAKEQIAADVWGLSSLLVTMTVEPEFIDKAMYFKSYDDVINVADLCMMTENGEEILLNATNVSNVQFADDFSVVYGLNYYVEEEGGEITKIIITDKGIEKSDFDGFVKEYTVSKTGNYVLYIVDDKLFFVGEKNKKVLVDQGGIETFGVLEGDELLYFFREASLGSGNAYVRGLGDRDEVQMVAEKTHYCWDFGEGKLAFLTDYDFASSTGSMYITDGKGGYEMVARNVELPLFFNYIY